MKKFTKTFYKAVLVVTFLFLTTNVSFAQFPIDIGSTISSNSVQLTGNAIARDASNNVYVTGYLTGSNTIALVGNNGSKIPLTCNGFWNAYVVKYNSSGVAQWAFTIGGSGQESSGNGIAVDASGNVYVTGYFGGGSPANFGGTGAANNITSFGGEDAFVAKYNSSGVNQWAFPIGNANEPSSAAGIGGMGIAIDAAGNVLVTGQFTGDPTDFGGVGGSNILSPNASFSTSFLAKYNASGNNIWAFFLPSPVNTHNFSYGVATDASNNVFITGVFNKSCDFAGMGSSHPLTTPGGTGSSNYIAKYNSSGIVQWAFQIGAVGGSAFLFSNLGLQNNSPFNWGHIATDLSGNVLVTGNFFGSPNFCGMSATTNMLTANSGEDVFVAKYNTSGNYVWAFNFGTTSGSPADSTSYAGGIATDAFGSVYITGNFEGSVNFNPTGGGTLTSLGMQDVYTAKYSSAGAYQWAFNIGSVSGSGSNTNFGNAITVDGSNNPLITGSIGATVNGNSSNSDFKGMGNSNVVNNILTSTAYVAKYNSAGINQWAFDGAVGGVSGAAAVARDGSNNAYITGIFQGTLIIPGGGGTLSTSANSSMFVIKYSPTGACLGSFAVDNATPKSIAIDASGKVLVTGSFAGSANFGGGVLTSVGSTDIFVAQYNSALTYAWANAYGGAGADGGNAITSDGSGNVYVTGSISSAVNFGGGALTFTGNKTDIFVAKFNSSGTHTWSFSAGPSANNKTTCVGTSIAIDGSGNVVTGGTFTGTVDFKGTSAGPNTLANSKTLGGIISLAAGYVAQYSSAGAFNWAFTIGKVSASAAVADAVAGIVIDGSNNVLVTGTLGATGTFDGGATLTVPANVSNIFVGECSSGGTRNWAFNMGATTQKNVGTGIGINASNNLYITGGFGGTVNFNPAGINNLTAIGTQDAFVAEYGYTSSAATYVGAFSIGTSNNINLSNGIAIDACNNELVVGTFTGLSSFNPAGGATIAPYATDVFLSKYFGQSLWPLSGGVTITGQPTSPSVVCAGSGSPTFTVTASGGGLTYQWQQSTNPSSGIWTAVNNGGSNPTISGATTATLTLANPTSSMNGYHYRCTILSGCQSGTTDGNATLTVNPFVTATAAEPGTPAFTSLTASWDAVSGATSYFLDVATDNGFSSFVSGYNNHNVGNTTTALISGLAQSTTYYYRVRASNSCNTSSNSNTVSLTTLTPCNLITGGAVTPATAVVCSGGSGQTLTLSGEFGGILQWQYSTDNVNWSNIPGANAATYSTAPTSQNRYYRAITSSASCFDISSTTAVVNISATPVVTITNVSSTTATVIWSPYGTSQFNVSWSGAAGTGSAPGVTTNNFTISSLTPNSDLLITVTPASPICGGVSATSISTHTLCAIPTVTNVTATGIIRGFKVNWNAVGGATSYRVYYRDLGTSGSWSFVDTIGTTKTIKTLYGGSTLAVFVRAKDCPSPGNLGDASIVNYVTTNPLPSCSPAPTVTTSSACPNQIHVDISGTTPPYNIILRRISPNLTAGVSYPISTTSFNITIGTQYAGSTWEVFATKYCGAGGVSAISNVSIVTVKPGCPQLTNVVVSHPSCFGFSVSWNGDDCAGLGISGYQLLIKKNGTANYNGYPVGTATHSTVSWLPSNNKWNVVVMSVACNGATSAFSVPDTISTLSCGRVEDTQDEKTINATETEKESITIYPNPTQRQFWIDLNRTDMKETIVKIELINQLGQTIQTNLSQVNGGHLNQLINTPEGLASGIYFVRTSVEGNAYINRLMISKE